MHAPNSSFQNLPLRLAIYGKGGIGKSTISANLSATFAALGLRVLQIGCDPKHDSTRLLLDGRCSPPVLHYLSEGRAGGKKLDLIELERRARSRGSVIQAVSELPGLPTGLTRHTVMKEGWGGVHCIEAGGPLAGIGCAGRGLLSLFALLDLLDIRADQYDVVLYDVLGDVVCGGFAVPLRAERANRILLVSSEEHLALYAANNLLRCVQSFDRDQSRLVGLVLNRRDNGSDDRAARTLLARTGLPCLSEIPRSPVIREAERRQRPIIDVDPDSDEAELFRTLARRLLEDPVRVPALPMAVPEFEQLCRPRTDRTSPQEIPPLAPSPRPPLATPAQGQPLRLAIYGKGGIGKSTIAANLSAALTERGLKVLHVGCDPKQDSTRLLRGGQPCRTVLQYLQDTEGGEQRLGDLLQKGYGGLDCVESGGPHPGVGCAGRGIISGFALMEKLGLDESAYDVILYDVIGDVVCGGFAMPLRKGYANAVLLVSSEEYLSLYASNHLLRGIQNMLGTRPTLLGLIHNVRDNGGDFSGLQRFCASTGLPLYGRLPRSGVVRQAEALAQPLTASYPASDESTLIHDLAERLFTGGRVPARPLGDEELERVVLGGESLDAPPARDPHTSVSPTADLPERRRQFHRGCAFTEFEEEPEDQTWFYREPPRRQPVWGCAFNGALNQALSVQDAVVVAHAPRSCAHIRRAGLASGASKDLKRKREHRADRMQPNMISTDMDEQQMIHGGQALLVNALRTALARKPRLVYLVTACPSAIIGDDIAAAVRDAQRAAPDIPIIPLRSDGNMTGGSQNGMLSALFDGILEQADPTRPPRPGAACVNLVLDKDKTNSAEIKTLLAQLGIEINASFSTENQNLRIEEMQRFYEAPVTLLAKSGALEPMIRSYLAERSSMELGPHPFPRGRFETERWLRWLGQRFERQAQAEALLQEERARYEQAIAAARPTLRGKTLVIFGGAGSREWVLDTALDLEMKPLLVAIAAREEDMKEGFEKRHQDKVPHAFCYHPDRRFEMLADLKPDAVLIGVKHDLPPDTVFLDLIGTGPIGFASGTQLARRWHALFRAPRIEGWRTAFSRTQETRP